MFFNNFCPYFKSKRPKLKKIKQITIQNNKIYDIIIIEVCV